MRDFIRLYRDLHNRFRRISGICIVYWNCIVGVYGGTSLVFHDGFAPGYFADRRFLWASETLFAEDFQVDAKLDYKRVNDAKMSVSRNIFGSASLYQGHIVTGEKESNEY